MKRDATCEAFPLVAKQRGRKPCVSHRVIHGIVDQLVVLHKTVIGVFRKCDRRKVECVDDGPLEQAEMRGVRLQDGKIVTKQIVAEDIIEAIRKAIQFVERRLEVKPSLALEDPVLVEGPEANDRYALSGLKV